MSRPTKLLAALTLLAILPLGGALWAADPEGEGDAQVGRSFDADEYVEVRVPYAPTSNTIATKLPVSLHRTPAHIGAVTGALLREQGAGVLTDALVNISGMNVQSGSGVHDYFVLRGFNSLDGSLVLMDGAPEPEVTYYPMYNVDAVEVLKGPGGFLYGANPLSGTVNIVRKQPLPGELLTFQGNLGSHNTGSGSIDWNKSNDRGDRAFRLNAFWRESDNFRDAKNSTQLAVNPSFTMRFGDNTSLNLNLEYSGSEAVPDGGLPLVDGAIPDVPRERSYESPFDYSDQDMIRFQVDFETQLSDNVKLRNKAYHRDLEWMTDGTLILGATPAAFGGDVFRALTRLDDHQKLTGNQLETVIAFETGRVKHQLLAGIEYTRLADDFALSQGPLPNINAFNPVETATTPTVFPFTVGDSTSETFAPYVIDQIEFSDKVQLQIGARYDSIDWETNFIANVPEPFLNGSGYTRSDTELSPSAGLVIAPTPDLTLFANASESFAPIGPRVVNAANLRPEQSQQVEVGAKKRFRGGKLQATLAVYKIERERIPITDPSGFTQVGDGDQESEGFEFELTAEPRPRLRTFFSYAYTDSVLTRFESPLLTGGSQNVDGNDPAFVPEHLANLWISKSFTNGFGVGGGLRHVGKQFIHETNGFAIDSYTIVDAVAFYDFEDYRLKLNVKNLTDEDYETRGFGAGSVAPADPLTVYAGFEWRR